MSSVSSRPPDPQPGADRRRRALRQSLVDLTTGQPSLCDDLEYWVDELAAAGLERRVAHRLTLITVVVVALRELPAFLGSAAEHISVALTDLDTFEAVQIALVGPDLGDTWDALAEATQAPISRRCRMLARLCRRKGLQVVAP